MAWFFERRSEIARESMSALVDRCAAECLKRLSAKPRNVLLLPPDVTRAHSGAGWITERLYNVFAGVADVTVIPTLGQHLPHTEEQNRWMFGSVPERSILKHDWKRDCTRIGAVSAQFVEAVTEGKADWEIPISINRLVVEEPWDLVVNIGHVVPHEVLGFANHNKNYFIGLGGKDTICASHMAAACCGIENNLGSLVTPLRHCFNKAENEFLGRVPDVYLLVVMGYGAQGNLVHTGLYCGDDLDTYLLAAEHSRRENVTVVPPLRKVVAMMQGDEFFSTWVANKAIYRTRKAMADGGELVVIAPGLKRFGEQPEVDAFIRTYGYVGTSRIMELWKKRSELHELAHATAHLMHGSTEGRFTVTYAPGHLSREEVESVNYRYLDYEEAIARYRPDHLKNGFNTMPDGEEIYFIRSPSVGLWTTKEKLAV